MPSANRPPGDYSSNLESQPDAFLEDDDNSDEDVGKQTNTLNFDDDDKAEEDEELVPTSQSELIDLGKPTQRAKAAANIPKLSGP